MKMVGDKKLSKTVSTKLTAESYELCQKIARDYYIDGKIKTPSISELTRFALERIFNKYQQQTNIKFVRPPSLAGLASRQ